jgi:N utilization substance protein A
MLSEHGLEDDTEAGDIIMAARAHWFDDEESEVAEMPAGETEADADTGDAPAAS